MVFLSAVVGLGIAAQWVAWRIKLPSILLLLGLGFAVGFVAGDNPDVPGITITDEMIPERLLFAIVSLAVAVIMFEGGLTLQFHELEASGRVVLSLVTVGVIVTWIPTALACHYLIGMAPAIAVLAGSILVVTGPTVIAPLIRHVRPSRRVGSIVKWEGIVIDPIGAVLAVLTFKAAIIKGGPAEVSIALLNIVLIGVSIGLVTAYVLVQLMKRYWIPDFLHNPVFLATAIASFALSNVLAHESGLVTVTVLGVALANQKIVPVRHVVEFKENLRVLLISCLFVVLAARIQMQDILQIGFNGLLFLFLLIVVIRPLSVFISTIGSGLSRNERIFLGFLAPRGIVAAAVSSVFALDLREHYLGELPIGADKIVPLTFLVIVGTVTFYGLSALPLARRLGLAASNPQGILFAGAAPWVRKIAKAIHDEGVPVLMVDTNFHNVANARMEGVPARCASIVSEYMEEMDLGGIGRLMAMTPNDDLNRLAAIEFESVFGREHVYQLPIAPSTVKSRATTGGHIQGRYLFGETATHADLSFRFASGAEVKKTKITENFNFEQFLARYGDSALVLFLITETKQIKIATFESPISPKAGQSIIALVDQIPANEQVLAES